MNNLFRGKLVRLKLFSWRLLGVLGKYKFVLLIPLVVLVGLGFWQYNRVKAENNWKQATDHYRRADYDSAAKILNKMPMPEDAERLGIYAQTMLATRQLDKSAKAYGKLYEVKKDPFSKLVLGNIYNEQKRYDDAARIYQEIITANPSYVQAYVNLAIMYKMQGNRDQAVATTEKGVENNPNNTVLTELLVSLTMDDRDSKQFKQALEKLKKLNPNAPLLELINK